MRFAIAFCLLVCTISLSVDKHGGQGIHVKWKKFDLMDFHEGRDIYDLVIPTEGSFNDGLTRAARRLNKADPKLYGDLSERVYVLLSGIIYGEVEFVPDAVYSPPPKKYDPVQIANGTKDGKLVVNPKIWNLLAEVERVGLLVHQIIYERQSSPDPTSNSRRARAIVAHLFSDMEDESFSSAYKKWLSSLEFSKSGTVDFSYGTQGKVNFDEGMLPAIMKDGSILSVSADRLLAKFTVTMHKRDPDGQWDPDFGMDGKLVYEAAHSFDKDLTDWRGAVHFDSVKERVYVTARDKGALLLVAFNPDGSLVESFGSLGELVLETNGWLQGLFSDGEGRLYLFGLGRPLDPIFPHHPLVRILPNGNRDMSYGRKALPVVIQKLAISPEGKISFYGYKKGEPKAERKTLIGRLDKNGELDKGFGGTGLQKPPFNTEPGDPETYGTNISVDAKGGVYYGRRTYGSYYLARWREDGELDPEFGEKGVSALKEAGRFVNHQIPGAEGQLWLFTEGRIYLLNKGKIDRKFADRGSVTIGKRGTYRRLHPAIEGSFLYAHGQRTVSKVWIE